MRVIRNIDEDKVGGDNTKNKTKALLIIVAVALASTLLVFAPILPVKAQVASGTTQLTPQIQKILTIGNYSLDFDLTDFQAQYNGLNITAESFNVNANTHTEMNITTGFLIVNLNNAHLQMDIGNDQPISVSVAKAQLNIYLHMEGSYINYSCYADTTSSIADLINNALSNLS